MSARNFRDLLEAQWERGNFVCVGLDSDFTKIPESARRFDEVDVDVAATILNFNREIVVATMDLVCAYKPNVAFYEAYGAAGLRALEMTADLISKEAPSVPIILDAKRADIGNTNAGYVKYAFDLLKADAVTVHPYLGQEALQPFLARADKGIFVLCRTSNKGADEFQDLPMLVPQERVDELLNPMLKQQISDMRWPLYQHVAFNVAKRWNANSNCGLVVGATYPEELAEVRHLVGDMPILIPGVGAQGGDLEKSVAVGKDSRGRGFIVNSSRGIIFASSGDDYAEAAHRETMRLRDAINECLETEREVVS